VAWLQDMNATLIAEIGSAEEFAAVSGEWLAGALAEVFPGLSEGLRRRPAAALPSGLGSRPWGEPGQVLGMLEIGRDDPVSGKRRTAYSEKAWQRFLDRLAEHPFSAAITIVSLDDQGQPDKDWAYARVVRDVLYPGWATFEFSAPAAHTGWPGSAKVQNQWAGFVRHQAARAGACAGGMTDDSGMMGQFALERATGSWTWIRESRQVLRGYSWVTVVPADPAKRLGGADAMRASGAFCEVSELPDGSLWLRATPVINDFTGERVHRVFEALAPVLLTGLAEFDKDEYRMVDCVDAADYR
jgi:hypothetical protein